MNAADLANRPAFPASVFRGMTLRQHYAGLALRGLVASPDTKLASLQQLVMSAVDCADALIAELARPVTP